MRSTGMLFRWFSIAVMLATAGLVLFELVSYSREQTRIPRGVTIAGLPAGGMTSQEAMQMLLQVYSQPVEVRYNESVFYILPSQVGFSLDTTSMLAAVDAYETLLPSWEGFWAFLWNSPADAHTIPIKAEYSRTQLTALMEDLAARYDLPPIPPQPEPGRPFFKAGTPGTVLDREKGAELLVEALYSPSERRVNLPVVSNQRSLPSLDSLDTLIKQLTAVNNYFGLIDVYMVNLQTGQDLHLIHMSGEDFSGDPDVAFTAVSTIKIPILLATFVQRDLPLDLQTEKWLKDMLGVESGNDPADWLMQSLDPARGPLIVTQTLREMGLVNTFIAGYFKPGSGLLEAIKSPANQRDDIQTDLDPYNQTTPVDMGLLLQDIYQCSNGGGTLLMKFVGKITAEECGVMLDYMANDTIGVFIQAGVPEGTKVVHKHGWDPGIFHTFGDAAIVYTPGGNYVLSIFLWQEDWLLWDVGSRVISEVSKAVYNYFNPPTGTR
ncbi:MAG: serine hydrolase [Anaerolineales bacterium]|nr:serine hydrolase [Anaerolineales bacterium]